MALCLRESFFYVIDFEVKNRTFASTKELSVETKLLNAFIFYSLAAGAGSCQDTELQLRWWDAHLPGTGQPTSSQALSPALLQLWNTTDKEAEAQTV